MSNNARVDELREDHAVVVIEGAGSPAEINLADSDVVNMRVARHADAQCLLVTDIDRGGAFAHLYGSWALLPEAERQYIKIEGACVAIRSRLRIATVRRLVQTCSKS